MSLLPLSLLFAGCTPQDAEITADYAIYLAAASSENLGRLARTGTDVEASAGKLGLTPIDCRNLSGLDGPDEIAAARLEGVTYDAECCTEGTGEECTPNQPRWFGWLDDYAYFLKEGKVEPWRTEAVITTEGDLQLTVHMDFPDFGDFRFGWVIDPDFQPTECVDGEAGAEEVDIDGNWLEGWSAGEEKGTLWHLNAGAYQINPSNNADYWYIEQDWMAGTTFGRFGDEEFYGHATDYSNELGRPFYFDTYTGGDCSNDSDDDQDGFRDNVDPDCAVADFEGGAIPAARIAYDGWVDNVEEFFADEVDDLSGIGKSKFPLQMKLEDNSWRPEDDVASGMDGWLGVSPSWVRIDNPQDIAVGNDTPITGEFQIYLEGLAAASKVLVRGTFKIDNVRDDVWGYKGPGGASTLDEVKRTENDTPACGEERLTSAD